MKEAIKRDLLAIYRRRKRGRDFLENFIYDVDNMVTRYTSRSYLSYSKCRKEILYIANMCKANGWKAGRFLKYMADYVHSKAVQYDREYKPRWQWRSERSAA